MRLITVTAIDVPDGRKNEGEGDARASFNSNRCFDIRNRMKTRKIPGGYAPEPTLVGRISK